MNRNPAWSRTERCEYKAILAHDVWFELTSHCGPTALTRVNSGGCPASRTCLAAADVFTMNWHEYFTYDAETGNLIWKERPREHFSSNRAHLNWLAQFPGRVAGCKRSYRGGVRSLVTVYVHNKSVPAHQIVWEMHNPSIAKGLLPDHINGDPWDNKIENLRPATASQNGYNRGVGRNNSSGAKGVHWCNTHERWVASIRVNKVLMCIGYYQNKEDAVTARREEELRLHGQYATNVQNRPIAMVV